MNEIHSIAGDAIDRRRFLGTTGTAFLALVAGAWPRGGTMRSAASVDGPWVRGPAGTLGLPAGFSYRVLSKRGDPMADGLTVPDAADGMGCFAHPGGKLALV